MYMKLYLALEVMTILLDTSKPTFMKYVWQWMEAIALKYSEVICWEKRFRNAPENVWCLVSVDGTDFKIREPFPFNKAWKSPKAAGAAVKYEVAVSIFSGDIVWINGPHVGSKNDVTIFRERLRQKLAPNEMAEVDAGYKGETDFLRARDVYFSEEERREKSELRARHETCNARFKNWAILRNQFRNDKKKHQIAFYAIAVMTQMSIDNGNVLFACEPLTRKKDRYHM
jgi:hypothetical protein